MSTQEVRDYLTKQIFIQNNVVTYRTLSCALQIHVNAAKNELAGFHAIKNELGQAVAVYLVSGQKAYPSPKTGEDYDMDQTEEPEEEPPRLELVLVSESELSRVKEEFTKIHCVHVYSLSASIIREPALLCGDKNTLQDPVGNIVSEDVKLRKGKAKAKHVPKVEPIVEKKPVIKKEPTIVNKPEPKEKPKELKPKLSGKLDFSKAKTKEQKAKEKAEAEAKQRAEQAANKAKVVKEEPDSDSKPVTVKKVKESRPKEEKSTKGASSSKQRGVKRKGFLSSESEANESGEESSSSTHAVVSKAKVKSTKPITWSDDEDSDAPAPKRLVKGKKAAKRADTDDEDEASNLMDIADDQVEDLTHRETPVPSTAPPTEDEAIMSDSDTDPVPKKKARKPKKVIPVGRNGLKKRRVVKTRMTKDAKGYQVTEDYSSYESVDSQDEEAKEPPKKVKADTEKKKGKAKVASTDSGDESSERRDTSAKDTEMEVDKDKPKKQALTKKPSTTSSAKKGTAPKGKGKVTGQSKLSNFFGPPKPKK